MKHEVNESPFLIDSNSVPELMAKIRIILADDNPAMLQKIATFLENMYEIAGVVRDGRAAVEESLRKDPDVILMDISMPVLSGIEAAQKLIEMHTRAKIIFLTVHEDPDFVKAALATGASGYVIKLHLATDLIPAIKEALACRRFVSPWVRTSHTGD